MKIRWYHLYWVFMSVVGFNLGTLLSITLFGCGTQYDTYPGPEPGEPPFFTVYFDFEDSGFEPEDFLFVLRAVSLDFQPPVGPDGLRPLGRAYINGNTGLLYLSSFSVWDEMGVGRRGVLQAYSNTLSHELGHLLGVSHSDVPCTLMSENACSQHTQDQTWRFSNE